MQPHHIHERPLLKPKEAFKQLNVGDTTGWGLIRTGVLQSVKIGKCRRIKPESVDAVKAGTSGSAA